MAIGTVRRAEERRAARGGLSPVQKKMYDVLSDGEAHTKQELFNCLFDELSTMTAIGHHITELRKYLEPKGMGILFVMTHPKTFRYRMVRFVGRGE